MQYSHTTTSPNRPLTCLARSAGPALQFPTVCAAPKPLCEVGTENICRGFQLCDRQRSATPLKSIPETAVSTLSASRLTWGKTKNSNDRSDLHRQEERESVGWIVMISKFLGLGVGVVLFVIHVSKTVVSSLSSPTTTACKTRLPLLRYCVVVIIVN